MCRRVDEIGGGEIQKRRGGGLSREKEGKRGCVSEVNNKEKKSNVA